MSKVVGIDLGTTFSAIAHVNEYGHPEIIPNTDSDRITPSVILFEEEEGVDKVIVGKDAKNQAIALPEQIVEFIKREMGKSKEDYPKTYNGNKYSPEELSAMILAKIKKDAEAYLKTDITDVVITVPAYFHDAEREATRNAGKIAGLNVLQILNEPTAAALAYGLDKLGSDQTVFVFDLGGGTFDVTIMKVSGTKIEMIATDGDHKLGGKEWDDAIMKYVAERYEIEHGENPLEDDDDRSPYQDLQKMAVAAKESLSKRDRARISCGYNGKTTRVELTRDKFEELTKDLLERCRTLCDLVLSDASRSWTDIDTILLVGGSTRMPMVREMVETISGKEINPHEVNPDETVAIGAAIQATIHQIKDGSAEADVPDSVIDRFIGEDGKPKVTVIDGATHNLGIIVRNSQEENIHDILIQKMTPVPCTGSNQYGTIRDDQRGALIQVMQGLKQDQQEDENHKFENFKLGECRLELPPGLPKGSPIEVTYKYNLDQTLEVTAKSKNSNEPSAIWDVFSLINRPTLDKEEVEKATKRLEEFEVE